MDDLKIIATKSIKITKSKIDDKELMRKIRLHKKGINEDVEDGLSGNDYLEILARSIMKNDNEHEHKESYFDEQNQAEFDRLIEHEKITQNLGVQKAPNRWEELEVLGQGSFGTVVKAINPNNGQIMAIKKITICSEDVLFIRFIIDIRTLRKS